MAQAAPQNPPGDWTPRRDRSLLFVAAFVVVSLIGHVVGFVAADHWAQNQPKPAPKQRPVELEIVQVEPPPPAPEPPPPPKPKVKLPPVKPPPVKIAKVEEPPPPPEDEAPPPPNDAPPPETPSKPVPIITGISMSSTTSAGTFAAPVGNTAYGRIDGKAADPGQVKQYRAPKYVPSYQLDREPSVLSDVKIPYPPDAKRAGIEGTVVLSVKIDEKGNVVAVKILSGPGYGMNEAAADAVRRFKYSPAIQGGEPVGTEITHRYTFYLD
ncbi:MAG: TonB family protein [Myxococcaceae bacterium]